MEGTLKSNSCKIPRIDRDLIGRIRKDYSLNVQIHESSDFDIGSFWASFTQKGTGPIAQSMTKFLEDNVALVNFWDDQQGLVDDPRGVTPSTVRLLIESLRIIEEVGGGPLMEKYPVGAVGGPRTFHFEGKAFTYRWARQIYFLRLFQQYLAPSLPHDFVALDIGGGYGLWAGLLKREFPQSTQVICDLPSQLVLAHYYLANIFPKAKLLTIGDFDSQRELDRDLLRTADFVLIPPQMVDHLAPYSCLLVSNFVSFGEMSRQYFDYYFKCPALQTNQYLYTVNRIRRDNGPMDEQGNITEVQWTITLLDYPLDNYETMHFAPCQLFRHVYLNVGYVYGPH